MDWKKLFLSFDGRIRRQDFWIAWLVIFGASVVLGFIPILGMLSIALIYPQVCINSTRLHDMGKSGWLQLIPIGVWIVCLGLGFGMFGAGIITAAMSAEGRPEGEAVAAILGSLGGFIGLMCLAALVNLAFLIWIGATPGQPGENRYGPAPGEAAEETFT